MWLALAALAHNLTRATGALASAFHARATTATIRARQPGPLRPPPHPAPARTLGLERRLHPAVQHGACTAGPLTRPDRPARKGPRPVDKVEELGRPAATPCPNPQLSPNTACTTPKRSTGNQSGGSGVRQRTQVRGVLTVPVSPGSPRRPKRLSTWLSRKRRQHSMDTHCSFTPMSSIQLPRMRDRVGALFHDRSDGDQWRTTNSPLTQNFSI